MSDFQSQDPSAAPTAPPAPAAPAAPAGQYGGYAPAQPRYNTLAIVGFILSFIVSIAGIIVSAIALNQIKKTGERGHGLALWGLILGIVFLVLSVVVAIISFAAAAALVNSGTTY
ncbi:DUF4190 domain-containing protein [Gryllotalpicola daejeonensis]